MSFRYSLDREDFKSVGKGILIAIAGFIATYGTQMLTGFNFGAWQPFIAVIWMAIVNICRKFITGKVPDNSYLDLTSSQPEN